MSNGRIWLGALAIGALAVGCGGNGGTQGAAGTSGTDVNGGKTMTLRGCIENGVPAGTYVLKTVGSVQGTEGETAPTSGSKKSRGPDINGVVSGRKGETTFRLIPMGSLDPGENLGREVDVTGEIATVETGSRERPTVPPQGQYAKGHGGAGTALENGGSVGSGGGRVEGSAPDQTAGAKFFRVTSMTKISENCPLPEGGK